MKVLFSYILIFCFVVIAAPKSVFHDHHHDHDHTEYEGDAVSQDHEDCFTCDFDYSSMNASVVSQLAFKLVEFNGYLNDRLIDGESSYSYELNARGPPATVTSSFA